MTSDHLTTRQKWENSNFMAEKSVLVLLEDGFEEVETIAPVDVLRRAGARVVLASLGGKHVVRGRSNVSLLPDTTLESVKKPAENFDLLFIPGGPAVMEMRRSPKPKQLAQAFAEAGRIIGAICAAPLVLLDAGLLTGKRFTAHYTTLDELPDALQNERVIRDGNIITSRGMGTALDFALELSRALFDESTATQLANDIML
ncbi:MAG: DJ-1/PfpI family protein [Puniceicoccales bacterium]|jgi:4-methyl-5(b-hydroxyethyl)-thiazole monophosphate biosynthesis|nr:DJ-1/PfpI family protein [Puniceicoccales bacterium]